MMLESNQLTVDVMTCDTFVCSKLTVLTEAFTIISKSIHIHANSRVRLHYKINQAKSNRKSFSIYLFYSPVEEQSKEVNLQ